MSGKTTNRHEILKLPYLVIIVSLFLTVGVTYLFYSSSQSKDKIRFKSEVERINSTLKSEINSYIAMLKAGRGFIESSEEINRRKFAGYVSSLELEKNYPGVLGIGFTRRILPGERQAIIEKMRSEGDADFKIFPNSERAEYQAITYLEPLNELNRRAIGYDMSTDPTRRAAMEKAWETGEAAMTGRVTLVQETEENRQNGFLIYLPIYREDGTLLSDRENSRVPEGFIFSPFRAGDFLQALQKDIPITGVGLVIYDTEAKGENLLAQTSPGLANAESLLATQTEIDVAGRKWIVQYKSLPAFAAQSSLDWSPIIFFSGLVFSLLLFGATYLESSALARTEDINEELSKSEREKAMLLESEQKARETAEKSNRAKDEFISIVSHELRTPLNSIAGWTHILQSKNISEEIKRRALQSINKSLRTQTYLVEELLEISQIMTGKLGLEKESLNFSLIFEEAFAEVEEQAKEKKIELVKENTLNGQQTLGDANKIKSVFRRLLLNAVKFTPEGGEVAVRIHEKDDSVELSVRDTGQGISREFLPYIFERFRQADSSITRKHGGLGLGLAISRYIVEMHGGTIEAKSQGEGKGSVFVVKFPFKGG